MKYGVLFNLKSNKSITRHLNKDLPKQGFYLLESEELIYHSRIITKEKWVHLLQATGLDENDIKNWHIEFENMSPEAHQDFLESLGITNEEIKSIREFSQKGKDRN